ncbi:MAG: hypothetical protein QM611_04460 [Microbacterium sp.]|uniref:hypothetical protein n=1 Tax=Microbacterium sp. TaxID=51671 RepID=UPI0039E6E0D2
MLGTVLSLGGCSPSIAVAGGCADVSNPGSEVVVSGTKSTPGSDRGGGGGSDSTDPGAGEECVKVEETDCAYGVMLGRDLTASDIAHFAPALPTLAGEPRGVGVVGMPTNFHASASVQQIAGELFNRDVVVRFTPAQFRFSYGDGSSRTSTTGGTTWSALGQAEFTPTATSHVYDARGRYPVSVTVSYSAAVDFGTGWIPVSGYVEATRSGYGVRVVEVHTALVDRTCVENPGGPGC